MKVIFALLLSLIALSCREPAASEPKVIIGPNNLSPVDGASPWHGAIGKIGSICTGFHIGQGLVLTAGHCIKSMVCTPEASFVWKDGNQSEITSHCIKVISTVENDEMDYALLKVFPQPTHTLPLSFPDLDAIGEESPEVNLISLPLNQQLSSSGPCQLLGPDFGQRVFHDCDSTQGSSGAPLFDNQGNVTAIHNRGSLILRKNSATLLSGIPEMKEWSVADAL